jgi:hypothetical protein
MLKEIFLSIKRGILSIFSDGTQKISFMRVSSGITLVSVLYTYIYKNIVTEGYVDFGAQSAYIVLFVLGAKVASGFQEAAKDVKMKEMGIQQDPTAKP